MSPRRLPPPDPDQDPDTIAPAAEATLGHVASRGVIPRSELRRLALASLPGTALLLLDEDLRITAAAGAVEESHGCEAEQLLGLHIDELLAPQSARAGVRGAQLALEGQTRILRVRPRTSPERVLELKTAPLLDDDGDVAGVLAASRDVTTERAAEATLRDFERRYHLLVEDSTDLISRQDPDGTCLWVSRSVQQLLGRRPSELTGRAFDELVHPSDRRALRALLTGLADGGEDVRHTYRLHHRDGRWLWLETVLRAVRDPDTAAVSEIIGVGRDVTARVEAERALERSNADLGQFATVASHDLAEPLLLMRSAADLLLEEAGERLDEEDRHRLDVIARNARKMQALIDTLLSYAAVDRTIVIHEPVDMVRVVDDALALLDARIAATGAVVRRGPLAPVTGDARLLGVLLQNLLSNAMKFCDAPPRIDISCEPAPGGWLLAVADNGIGIPAAQLRRIFGMFERLDRSRYPGLGLGLATAQRIAEIHGGHISVTSQVGDGSTFEVVLPSQPA
jgi:PAS domain S-box-containing protein